MGLALALNCESSWLPTGMLTGTWQVICWSVFIGWNRLVCGTAFQALIQKILLLYYPFRCPMQGVSVLRNCAEAEKLIYCCISQEDSTLCSSFHPESSLDTLHSRHILVPHSVKGEVEKKNEDDRSRLPQCLGSKLPKFLLDSTSIPPESPVSLRISSASVFLLHTSEPEFGSFLFIEILIILFYVYLSFVSATVIQAAHSKYCICLFFKKNSSTEFQRGFSMIFIGETRPRLEI